MYFFEPLILSFEVGVRKGVISGGDRPQRLKGGGAPPTPWRPSRGWYFWPSIPPILAKKRIVFSLTKTHKNIHFRVFSFVRSYVCVICVRPCFLQAPHGKNLAPPEGLRAPPPPKPQLLITRLGISDCLRGAEKPIPPGPSPTTLLLCQRPFCRQLG